MKLNINTLYRIKNQILSLNYEVCGHIRICDDNLILVETNQGNIISNGKRGSCQYDSYGKYIWHSHPNISKGYPSMEDIQKSLKLRNTDVIQVQIILTSWGIWEIYTGNKKHITPEIQDRLKSFKLNINSWLYSKSLKGKQLPQDKILNKYIRILKHDFKDFKLKVKFTSWEKIFNKGYYRSKYIK